MLQNEGKRAKKERGKVKYIDAINAKRVRRNAAALAYTGSVPSTEWLICAFVLQTTTGAALAADAVSRAERTVTTLMLCTFGYLGSLISEMTLKPSVSSLKPSPTSATNQGSNLLLS